MPGEIDPKTAYARLESEPGSVYLDVRSVMEFDQGHPTGAWNIPILHATPSGNVIAQQEGQNLRTGQNNNTRVYLGEMGDATKRRGQDLYDEQSTMRDLTTKRGQDFQFDLGVMRNNTAQRGQDITKLLGIDRNAIAHQGLDVQREAETGREIRASAANDLRLKEIQSREKIEGAKRVDPWRAVTGAVTPPEVREGTGTV